MRNRAWTTLLVWLTVSWLPSACLAAGAHAEGEVLVVFRSGRGTDDCQRVLGRHALGFTKEFRHMSRAAGGRTTGLVRQRGRSTAKLIELLKAEADVESVEPNYRLRKLTAPPNDPHFSQLWGLSNTGQAVNGTTGSNGVDIRFLQARSLARRSPLPEVVVGVLDFGFDPSHPDLGDNLWRNLAEIPANGVDDDRNGYIDDVTGYDFGVGTAALTDPDEHGTHVAGTIAALGNNATGIVGVAHRAKLLLMKGTDSAGDMFTDTTIEAFNYAIALKQRGVNLVAINASYGSSAFSSSERLAIEALRNHGIVLCAAAGNDGTNNDTTPLYPASYDTNNILSIAAHTQTGALASFSNFGATSVDLAAPGDNIYSLRPLSALPTQASVRLGASNYPAQTLEFAGTTSSAGITRTLHHCALGYPADFPAAVAGNIALIERGVITFATKVSNARAAGAVAAIIYDNTSDPITVGGWTLSEGNWLPAVRVTRANGLILLGQVGQTVNVTNFRDLSQAYQFLDGTSMAAPHVTAAVAIAAQNFPNDTLNQRIARITSNVTPVAAFAGRMTSSGRLNLQRMLDSDQDDLADWWEIEQFGHLGRTAVQDDDGDGFVNGIEFRAATNPRDATSRLALNLQSTVGSDGQLRFECVFPGVAERRYQLEWSYSLQAGSWQPLAPPLVGTGEVLRVQDPQPQAPPGRKFYRLALLPD